jgi:hypothetical protein
MEMAEKKLSNGEVPVGSEKNDKECKNNFDIFNIAPPQTENDPGHESENNYYIHYIEEPNEMNNIQNCFGMDFCSSEFEEPKSKSSKPTDMNYGVNTSVSKPGFLNSNISVNKYFGIEHRDVDFDFINEFEI